MTARACRKVNAGRPGAKASDLKACFGNRREHDVPMALVVRAPVEVVQPEFAIQRGLLLFDPLPLMDQRDHVLQRRGDWKILEGALGLGRRPEISLAA